MIIHLPPASKAEAKALLGIVFHYLSWWWVWGVLVWGFFCCCCGGFSSLKPKGKLLFFQSAVFKEWETIQCVIVKA